MGALRMVSVSYGKRRRGLNGRVTICFDMA